MKLQFLNSIVAGFTSASKINQNFSRITDAFQNTVSRDGSTPNDMEADLDMGGNRIINVGTPADPTDAVRLQDIIDLNAGELTLSQDYNDLVNVPDTFPPEEHNHVAADITDIGEYVEDKIGSKLVGGTNITVSYNDTTGETTVSATGSVSTAWADITGKPSTFTPSAHTHTSSDVTDLQETVEDYIGSAITAGTNITVSYNDTTGKTTINSTASGSGVPSLEDYGGVGDGSTDNVAAFAAAQASTDKRIYLKDTYKTSGSASSIQYDRFYGPGKILFGTTYRPASYHNITTKPTSGTGTDLAFYYSGDTSKVNVEHWRFGSSSSPLRVGLSENYYDTVTTPDFKVMQSFQGYSGATAFTTASITTGATTVSLNLTAGGGDDLASGREFVFANGQNNDGGTIYHTATSLGVSGSTLTFTPAVPSATTIPSGACVYIGKRTHHAISHYEVTHSGGGDAYCWLGRIFNEYQPTKGQTHFFNTATIGLIGGDLVNVYDGQYSTGIEFLIDGGSTDSAGIGLVMSFNRNNNTSARGEVWTGIFMQSFGTKALDSAITAIGKYNVGIDLAGGASDFGTNKGAIGLKLGDRIHFANTSTTRTVQNVSLIADTYPASPIYIGSDTVSGVRVLELYNGIYRLRLQENGGLTTNASITTGGNFIAGGTVQSNAGIVYLSTDGSRLEYSGGSIKLYKAGSLVQTW